MLRWFEEAWSLQKGNAEYMVVSGCGTLSTVPLEPVTYDMEPQVRSNATVKIELQTGIVGGVGGTAVIPMGGGIVPVSGGPVRELHFDEEDQLIFVK